MVAEHLHINKRKRIHRYKEKYPSLNKTIRFIDNLVAFTSWAFPLTVIPQVIRIWYFNQVEGVSLWTWLLFLVFNTTLLVYAVVHKEKRLIAMWALFSLGYLAIVIGILVFS